MGTYKNRHYRTGDGCRFIEKCEYCYLDVCLFDKHDSEKCDIESSGKFIPDIPVNIKIRPQFSGVDVRLILRAFNSYIEYGIACENGDSDRLIALFISMMRKVDFSKGGKIGFNPGFGKSRKLYLEMREKYRSVEDVNEGVDLNTYRNFSGGVKRISGINHPWRKSVRAYLEKRKNEK